ncbi:cytochrome ubiquinol oxidase subunit I [Candidatus Protochlamydia phocaeensis]|uniref:cytochrome ubiquinol oxidase subunit I n=1 Tax=Candidatus Protochlamydia phocaeensis TaxID=1414722 RepID=UPI000838C960|nr:cytochrome ubiquinol oxidase subunit I [Candidatus Protochlamydia phocaeensis]
MDVLILARLQFALTIMFHYIFPVLSIGLGLIMVIVEAIYLKTKNPLYLRMAQFWTKIFALTFAIGVATGIVMEFEFGTNWATYSRYVGDVFGSALASEGIFAFFLESGFLAVVIFGWNRVSPKMHFFSTLMVCLGAHFSAVWIVVANSWMQTPAGYHIVGEGLNARAEIIGFWEMVFNPSSVVRLGHVILGCWLAGAFLVISISAYYLLKKRHMEFARKSINIGLWVALVATILQAISGDSSGKVVAKHQPTKLAALEALYKTEEGAPLTIFGVVNSKEEKLDYALRIPKLLSFLSFGDANAEVKGLDQIPREDWPNVPVLFNVYRLMIGLWALMFFLAVVGLYLWRKRSLERHRWMLWLMAFSAIYPQLANQAGWYCAESGRYPWIVYGLLRISEGLSKSVTANQILGSIIMFMVVYTFLFILFIYLLNEKVKHGPEEGGEDISTPYHGLHHLVEGGKRDVNL